MPLLETLTLSELSKDGWHSYDVHTRRPAWHVAEIRLT